MDRTGKDYKQLTLSTSGVATLFIYYALCVALGCAAGLFAVLGALDLTTGAAALVAGTSFACAGAAVTYIRRLYRAVFSDAYTFSDRFDWKPKSVATLAYLLFRPAFGSLLGLVCVIVLLTGADFAVDGTLVLSDRFPYACLVAGLLVGLVTGPALDKLDKQALQYVSEKLVIP